MELWVRTQGKDKLVKIEYVQYLEGYDPIDEYDGFTTNEIWANEEEVELGQYKTKERCLEIIDEIQSLLVRGGTTDDKISALLGGTKAEFIVYEMPKE